MFTKIKNSFNEYPAPFKILTLATFIDMLGTFLLYPFFSLYITDKFGVGMTIVGIFFGINAIGGIIGGTIGGALADKFGRKTIILFGLVVSGIGSIFMGLVNDLLIFFIIAAILGVLGSFGRPARQAMVSDLLPHEKQAQGFGILRVAFNLSAVAGPLLGGFLAKQSFLLLFILDAISSLVTAVIVFLVIPETKPEKIDNQPEESFLKTIVGYKEVLKDGVFMIYCLISVGVVLVYMNMNSTLSVFLRDIYGFSEVWFGLLLAMNAAMVVFFQIWIANKISKYDPMKMMALGTIFYMVGFGMYGFISEFYLFFIAMAIITIGEMIITPVSQTAVSFFAPQDKRGRYMAFFGFTWGIPSTFGVIISGLIMDYIGPNWLWYIAGIIALITAIGFWLIRKIAKDRLTEKKKTRIN